jgi:hypothetical protein
MQIMLTGNWPGSCNELAGIPACIGCHQWRHCNSNSIYAIAVEVRTQSWSKCVAIVVEMRRNPGRNASQSWSKCVAILVEMRRNPGRNASQSWSKCVAGFTLCKSCFPGIGPARATNSPGSPPAYAAINGGKECKLYFSEWH